MDEVAPNFNMGAIHDRKFWSDLLDEGDQTWHLRVI
jgi:hypothetical protein